MPPPFEPYVAEPQEPRLPARGTRLETTVITLIAGIMGGAVAWFVIGSGQSEDPALRAPSSTPQATVSAVPDPDPAVQPATPVPQPQEPIPGG